MLTSDFQLIVEWISIDKSITGFYVNHINYFLHELLSVKSLLPCVKLAEKCMHDFNPTFPVSYMGDIIMWAVTH